ncbi:SAM-dependent methyltransferase, partial [Streptomyces sp. NPDC004290]
MTTDHSQLSHIDTSRAHPARVYDWLLGGKDNYPVDEAVGETLPPEARDAARQNRAFMHRAAAYLAAQGVDQFLDIGTGIPTEPNLHQIVQRAVPTARIVYADNDPIVLRHAEALLRSTPEGRTAYIQADAREPEKILAAAGDTLDFAQPIALSLVALLHLVADEDDPYRIVAELLRPLAPGSCLALSHATGDFDPEAWERV